MTTNTRAIASTSVFATSVMEAVMKGVVSYGMAQVTPCGKSLARRAICALTVFAIARALAPGSRKSPRPPAGLPSQTAALP